MGSNIEVVNGDSKMKPELHHSEQHIFPQEKGKQLAVCVRNAYKYYGSKKKPVVVLDGLNMTVPKGIIYGLLGASGCGKTTLLNCIVGRRQLNSGRIWVLGSNDSNITNSVIGFMPQEIALYGEFTIRETLTFFGWLAGMPISKIEERSDFLTKLLVLPEDDRRVKTLSGGQQRRVSLASSLLHKPELLILDEPTVGLDPILRENIWNHFLSITKEYNTTVIITTHYIDEARQAHTIALMREGYFLAEDSPQNLLNQYGFDSLEKVFLQLSIQQNTKSQSCLSKTAQNAIDASNNTIDSKNLSGINNEAFVMDEMGSASINGDKFSRSPSITSYFNNTESKSKKHYLFINKDHLRALLWKNFAWMMRNIPVMCCALLLPFIQGALFCLSIGHDPINLSIAVVNHETKGAGDCPDNMTCNSMHLGCYYLKYLEERDLIMMYYDSEEVARESVLKANTYASVVVKHNYSSALRARLETWNEPEPWDVYFSYIDVFRDDSNKFIAQYLQITMYNTFKTFVQDYLASCEAESRWLVPPIRWEKPVYGTTYPNFTDFVAPGVIVTFTSFLGLALTGLAMLLEFKEGILERLLITGVNEIEILISHGLCQFVIMVMQSIITLICLFVIFDITNQGSFFLVICFTLLSGVFGMCSGFLISCIFTSEVPALFAALGSFLPMIMLCGIIWPVEGMHYLLRSIVFLLPLTVPSECLRSIMQKGWDLTAEAVYLGFIIISVWSLVLLILSIIILKFRKL